MPKSFYFAYGHVVLQIQENEACNKLLANIMFLHTPSISGWVG